MLLLCTREYMLGLRICMVGSLSRALPKDFRAACSPGPTSAPVSVTCDIGHPSCTPSCHPGTFSQNFPFHPKPLARSLGEVTCDLSALPLWCTTDGIPQQRAVMRLHCDACAQTWQGLGCTLSTSSRSICTADVSAECLRLREGSGP